MLSETLNDGLQQYRIGQKIRALRGAKKLGLTQLGQHTGLSAGMLSKIERDQVFPTLPTLLRIAMVFGVGLDHFFAGEASGPVLEIVREKDRLPMPGGGSSDPTYYFESLDFPVSGRVIDSYLATFMPSATPSEPHAHTGVEMIYVIDGLLGLEIHDKQHVLGTGDSVYFDAGHDHSYRCTGSAPCKAVIVVRGQAG